MSRTADAIREELDVLRATRASGVRASEVSGEEGGYKTTFASGKELDAAIVRLERELALSASPAKMPAARLTRAVFSR